MAKDDFKALGPGLGWKNCTISGDKSVGAAGLGAQHLPGRQEQESQGRVGLG